jgi:hypothetical protein
MNNLTSPASYKPAPTAAQKGGRGYKRKRSLCKKKGGADFEEDIETGKTSSGQEEPIFANDEEYYDLDKAEKGEAGPAIKVGGSRTRNHSKSKKYGKGRKTRRHSRKGKKKHGRKSHKRY